MSQRRKFTPQFKEQAVRSVIESSRPIGDVAQELDVLPGTLGYWAKKYRQEHPVEEYPLSMSERARFEALREENRELRQKNEFLGKAAANSGGSCNGLVEDSGRPIVTSHPASTTAAAYRDFAATVTELLPPIEMAGCSARVFEHMAELAGL